MSILGTGVAGQYFAAPFQYNNTVRPFTLTGWIFYPAAAYGTTQPAILFGSSASSGAGAQIYISGSGNSAAGDYDGTNYHEALQVMPQGRWAFVMATFSDMNDRTVQNSNGPDSITGVVNAASYLQFFVGLSAASTAAASTGMKFAECAIWQGALGQAEYIALAAGSNPLRIKSSAQLQAYWPLRDNLREYGPRGIGLSPVGNATAVFSDHPQVLPVPLTRRFTAGRILLPLITGRLAQTQTATLVATGVVQGAGVTNPQDFPGRMRALLPRKWFPDTAPGAASSTPYLDVALNGMGWGWQQIYDGITYIRTQSRIATATDVWLDLISLDFFNGALPRIAGELDASFRARIKAKLFTPTATRSAITQSVAAATGRPTVVIEPWNTGDCGAVAGAGNAAGGQLAWGSAGSWGSLQYPAQFFVQAKRGTNPDSATYATLAATEAAGTIAWTQITN